MHLYIKLAFCLALLTDNPSNRYTGGNPEQGFWRRFADGLNQKFSFICDAGQSSQELKEKNYLQLYETDEIFGEHCDRRLPGNHQNARTQTLFFHQISDHGKLAVKKRGRNGEKKRKDRYSGLRSSRQRRSKRACFVSPVDISFLLRNYRKEGNSRSLVDTYYN